MKLLHQTPLLLTPVTYELEPGRFHASLVAKGTFRLIEGAPAVFAEEQLPIMGDEFLFGEGSSLGYAADLVPFKPKTDILFSGNCFTPSQQLTTSTTVAFQIGACTKQLHVRGDRRWDSLRGVCSDSMPFNQMPICYERAWGGARHKQNPIGVGQGFQVGEHDPNEWPLPNFELPNQPIDSPADDYMVAGFGPIPTTWEPRYSRSGTYDARWRETRWPGLPEDFQWGHFNSAPEDQQIAGYLVGNEPCHFLNLHPSVPQYSSALPGIQLSSYVSMVSQDENGQEVRQFINVPLALDTLWINVAEELMVIVWRGGMAVADESSSEIEYWYLSSQTFQEESRSDQEHYQAFKQSLEDQQQADAILTKEESEEQNAQLAASLGEDAKPFPNDLAGKSFTDQLAAVLAAGEQVRQAADAKTDEAFKKHQVDESLNGENISEKKTASPQTQTKRAVGAHTKAWKQADEMESQGVPTHQYRAELYSQGLGPHPPEAMHDIGLQEFLEQVRRGETFEQQDLTHLDLTGCDLSGAKLLGCYLAGVSLAGAKLTNAVLTKSLFGKADLAGADLSGCQAEDVDFTEAKLSQACLKAGVFTGSYFEQANLTEVDLSEAVCEQAQFTEANLKSANLSRGCFADSDFSAADLEEVNGSEADFLKSNFNSANAKAVNLFAARMEKCRANLGANFADANMQQLHAPNSVWLDCRLANADLSHAVLDEAQFLKANLDGTIFESTHLKKAQFSNANGKAVVFRDANLLDANFFKANLPEADFRASNAFGANFMQAQLTSANFDHANLEMTCLK